MTTQVELEVKSKSLYNENEDTENCSVRFKTTSLHNHIYPSEWGNEDWAVIDLLNIPKTLYSNFKKGDVYKLTLEYIPTRKGIPPDIDGYFETTPPEVLNELLND